MNDLDAAIVSGSDAAAFDDEHLSSDDDSNSTSNSSIADQQQQQRSHYTNKNNHNAFSNLYDPNGDEEDEAYVYKHLRGGVEEVVKLELAAAAATQPTNNKTQSPPTNDCSTNHAMQSHPHSSSLLLSSPPSSSSSSSLNQTQTMSILKPRHSDAILSCPCCFQIVCMDCQRHEKYTNQYRAMFVMNIGVDWNHVLDYSDHKQKQQQELEEEEPNAYKRFNQDAMDHCCIENTKEATHVYYSVHCLQCKTEVAALGMHDEVYHFFGCLVSG